jgi:hypothetical protein
MFSRDIARAVSRLGGGSQISYREARRPPAGKAHTHRVFRKRSYEIATYDEVAHEAGLAGAVSQRRDARSAETRVRFDVASAVSGS